MSNENAKILHKYVESISNDETLLEPFIALMGKQSPQKPIPLNDGLSLYKQNLSNNYSYRAFNPAWGVNVRKSCKTSDRVKAENIARDAWARLRVMNEFDLIKKEGETFIQFAERCVLPNLETNKEALTKQLAKELEPQVKKQITQKFNAVNKKINHLRKNCAWLHNKIISEVKHRDFEEFAMFTIDNAVDGLSYDTFTNYMTITRTVLSRAVSEGVIDSAPDTTISKSIKDRFGKKQIRDDLTKDEVDTIFTELDTAIQINQDNLSESKTSKYSLGKLRKLQSYKHYLKFILATGIRAGDECFLIRWSDFTIKNMGTTAKPVWDYYCNITGGKIESGKAKGRQIIVSKGTEKSTIFAECLSPLAKLQGDRKVKELIESKSNEFIFLSDLKDVQRYVSKWGIFSKPFIPYQFRHTYITKQIIEVGQPLDQIAKQCGNSVAEIQKTYNHATTERYRREELEKLRRV